MFLLTLLATGSGMAQVLSGAGVYGSNCGLGFYVGTIGSTGRIFSILDERSYTQMTVEPDSYQVQRVNPLCAIGWWSETPGDDFVLGYQAVIDYGVEKYRVGLGSELLTGVTRSFGVSLAVYAGWHFGSRWTASLGVQYWDRFPVKGKGVVDIFNSQSSVGLMTMLRYAITDDFFVALQAYCGLLSFGNILSEWEKYQPLGTEGYHVDESNLKPFTLMIGIGRNL